MTFYKTAFLLLITGGIIISQTAIGEDLDEDICDYDPLEPGLVMTPAERNHAIIAERLNATAQWLDGFFGDDRDLDEAEFSRVRLSLTHAYRERDPVDVRLRLRGRLDLPKLRKHFKLVFEGEPDENDPTGLDQESGSTAIRYTPIDTWKRKLSFDAGIKGGFSNPRFFTRVRVRHLKHKGNWLRRTIPTLEWDTKNHLQAFLQYDAEHEGKRNLFFRYSARSKWVEEQAGLGLDVNFSLFKRLSRTRYLAYDLLNNFHSEPDPELKLTQFNIRYRRAIWQDKLFLELSPGIRFEKIYDFEPEWQAYARLETVFNP